MPGARRLDTPVGHDMPRRPPDSDRPGMSSCAAPGIPRCSKPVPYHRGHETARRDPHHRMTAKVR